MKFTVGDRVTMRYGPGTVTEVWPNGVLGVKADVGGWWLCDERKTVPLDTDAESVEDAQAREGTAT